MTDYHVTLHAPEDYVVLSSGKAETKNGVTTIEAPNVREMAITACNFSTILSREINGVTINLMAADYAGYEEQYLSDLYHIMLTVAAESVELFSTKVGDYIYDELDVIPSKLESVGGMEMPGLVQVWMPLLDVEADSSIRMSDMSVVSTTHEVGHQWFYCAVSNDAFKEPWLDESFTSYLEYLYIDLFQEGKELMDSFNQKYVPDGHYWDSYRFSEAQGLDNDKPINLAYDQYDYLDYGMYVYECGAWFLRELELTMGSDRFFEMLSRWYAENLNQIVTGEAFIDHLLQYDSSEAVQQIIDEYISSEAL
jgi:aminopeptidase N